MYLRTVRTGNHEYLRLVEAYWEDGRSKQRVVLNLGRTDVLAPHLGALVRRLGGEQAGGLVSAAAIAPRQAACWGPFLVARTLWRALGLEAILDGCEGPKRRGARLADRALVLVGNRLCDPASEHGMADWLESDFVCDRYGRRIAPRWKRRGRVRVDLGWLQRWYRTLDELIAHKAHIEAELFARLRDLFALDAEMVFYDLTSTYFEGAGPAPLARHGYSRDGRPRHRQVLVGLVMINGWPIAHHVFRGNRHDSATLEVVLDDIERRFGLKRVVVVGDRGMVTSDNLERIKRRGQGYLVGLQRRRREDVSALIARARGPWQDCPPGIAAGAKAAPPATRVQEVPTDRPGVRVFVVHSDERQAFEQARRENAMAHTRAALEGLARRVAQGRLKAPEKIGAAAARILARHHGQRYYDWELRAGTFRFFEHPVHLPREIALEGKYVIQTEEPHLSPVQAVTAYKELAEVERGFRELKDVIEMRPIYHRTAARVQAHIFVAALAFLLDRALEKRLKANGVSLSAAQALKALRTVHVVDLDLGTTQKRGTTPGSANARRVLAALKIADREPPTPPKERPKTAT
ncbi:MAG: IS1634 family transposase [Kiloniellales bacterium]